MSQLPEIRKQPPGSDGNFGWILLITGHWLAIGLLANLWYGWQMLSPTSAGEYFFGVSLLAGFAFSISLGFCQYLVVARCKGLPIGWVLFYGVVFVGASWQWLGLVQEDYRTFIVNLELYQGPDGTYQIGRDQVLSPAELRNDMFARLNNRVAVPVDQLMLGTLILPPLLVIFMTLKRRWQFSVVELLIGTAMIALAITAWSQLAFLRWIEWSSWLFIVIALIATFGLWWGFVKLGGRFGPSLFLVFWALISTVLVVGIVKGWWSELGNLNLYSGLVCGFVIGQFLAAVGRWSDSWIAKRKAKAEQETIDRPVARTLLRGAGTLLGIAAVQLAMVCFVRTIDPTTFLVVNTQRWASARFAAEVLNFYAGRELQHYSLESPLHRPLWVREMGIFSVLVSRDLAEGASWERLDQQYLNCSPNGKWFHAYPVGIPEYMTGRHETMDVDGNSVPMNRWPTLRQGTFFYVHDPQISNDDMRNLQATVWRVSLVNPHFIEPFDIPASRYRLQDIKVDQAEQLLESMHTYFQFVYDDYYNYLVVGQQTPDQVAAILQEKAPDWAPWFLYENREESGTYVRPQSIESIVRLNGKAPPNLRLMGLSTDEAGRITGVRCSDGDPLAIEEPVKSEFFDQLDWLSIEGRVLLDSDMFHGYWFRQTLVVGNPKLLAMDFVWTWKGLDKLLRTDAKIGSEIALYVKSHMTLPQDFDSELCPSVRTLILPDTPDERAEVLAALENSSHLKRLILLTGAPNQLDFAPFLADDGRIQVKSLDVDPKTLSQDQLALQQSLRRLPFEVFVIDWPGSYEGLIDRIWEETLEEDSSESGNRP